MATKKELEHKLWKALKSDRTVMLGLDGEKDAHARPMTAQVEGEHGPVWFFTASDTAIVEHIGRGKRAFGAFSSKGHDLFATLHGKLVVDNDRAAIDRLWNPFVAAWFKGGQDDPKLTLLRFDTEHAEVWLNESSLLAGVKMLLGADPKRDYKDKVADVDLT